MEAKNLLRTLKEKRTATVAANNKALQQALRVLEEENIITTTQREGFIKVTVSSHYTTIDVEDKILPLKCKQLKKVAAARLPTLSGYLLLATRKGLLFHYRAQALGIGGELLCIIY